MDDAVDTQDIAVVGDPARARETAVAALTSRGFSLTWADEWNGTAIKGSLVKQALLGAFGTRFVVGVSVFGTDSGTVLRLARPSTGITAGLAGRARAKKQFASLVAELTQHFAAAGVLRPTSPPPNS